MLEVDILSVEAAVAPWRRRFDASGGRVLWELNALLGRARPGLRYRHSVALVGAFSAGKSTLLSALLDERAAHVHALPTSRCVTSFEYGAVPTCQIFHADGETTRVAVEHRAAWMRRWHNGEDVLDLLPHAETLAGASARVFLPHPLLRAGTVLLDTPGTDDLESVHKNAALGALDQADAVLLVSPRAHLMSEADVQIVDRVEALGRPWAVAVTRMPKSGGSASMRSRLSQRVQHVAERWGATPAVVWAPPPRPWTSGQARQDRNYILELLHRWRNGERR